MLDPQRSEDELIAYTLIQIQALVTGRTIRTDLPLADLDEDDLIAFWADPYLDLESL